ncbi:MAG: CBS domain-containing protein [Clostridia bacterium]
MKVKECMCQDVCTVKPETKIQEVAKLMAENQIGCVPVCDSNNCVCGIVTDRDILLRCVACEKDTNQTQIKDIMSQNVCTCKQDDDMTNAQTKMGQNQIRRLPVCDSNNKIVGILTIGDLAQNEQQLGVREVTTTLANICDCNGNQNDR